MITRVQAKNFKSFREIDVDLGPLTVFVGRNASGKSNFVDILRFVRDALTKGLDAAITERGGYRNIALKEGDVIASSFEISLTLKDEAKDENGNYVLKIGQAANEGFRVLLEDADIGITEDHEIRHNDSFRVDTTRFGFAVTGGKVTRKDTLPMSGSLFPLGSSRSMTKVHLPDLAGLDGQLGRLYSWLTQVDGFHFFPDAFRPPQQIAAKPFMNDEGHGLSSALKRLLEDKSDGRILSALSYVVNDVSDLRVRELGSYLIAEIEHRSLARRNGAPEELGTWIDFARESDGTLRVLGLLVGLYQNQTEGRVLAFEEPELSIHIGALQMIYGLFDEAALTRQIIVTTHSPDFIAQCKVEELRVVERVNGESKIGRLLKAQVKAINDQLFMSSDLIRIEGLRREGEEVDDELSIHA